MMTETSLERYLRQHTPEEEERLLGIMKDYSVFKTVKGNFGTPCYRFDDSQENAEALFRSKKALPNYYNFAVIKQDRFEDVPLHIHEWLELTFVYSGSCTITVDRRPQILEAGQMILIGQNTPHAVKQCSESDIVINFLLTREYLNGTFFERLAKDNYLTHFFIEALDTRVQEDKYFIFAPKKQSRLAGLASQFLCEFYSPSVTSEPILDSFMTLIICELINLFQHTLESDNSPDSTIYTILHYIERNCTRCTLESTAAFFNMHPNYLSAYIKKHTGITYKHLIQSQCLTQAAKLLRTTGLPTESISMAVGYQNTSFFFQKFKEKYGCTPKEYRQRGDS